MNRVCRWSGAVVLVGAIAAGGASGQPPQGKGEWPTECVDLGHVTVRLGSLLDTDALKETKAALQTQAVNWSAAAERDSGVRPDNLDRVTVAFFGVPGRPKTPPVPVVVLTPRQPVADEAVAKAMGGDIYIRRGVHSKPGLSLMSTQRGGVVGLTGTQVLLEGAEITKYPEARALLHDAFARARKRDEEAAARGGKENLIVAGEADIRALFKAIGAPATADAFPPDIRPFSPARRLSFTLSVGDAVAPRLRITFPDAAAAAAAKPAAESGQRAIADFIARNRKRTAELMGGPDPFGDVLGFVEGLVRTATVATEGAALTAASSAPLTPAVRKSLAASVARVEEASNRMSGQNNLKQIGLAMHNYEATNGRLPTDVHSKDGKPLLSWRIELLPYIEQSGLYQQFKRDEPWDSEHNKQLIPLMPKTYLVPGSKGRPGETFYRGFVGKKGAAVRPLFVAGETKGLTIVAIEDGSSNTFMVVEAADGVPWTRPDDLPFNPAGPLPKLGGHFKGGFNAAFCDGSVRFVPASTKPDTLKAWITANGGEVIPE